MENIAKEINKIVDETIVKLDNFTREEWNYRSAPGKWSKKEILGHLIDSAANNHQRFVRAQFEVTPVIIYDGTNWVASQRYFDEPAELLVKLWESYNRHLAYLVSIFPKDKYSNLCDIKKEEPVTIEWIIVDYVRHLKHHLGKITE